MAQRGGAHQRDHAVRCGPVVHLVKGIEGLAVAPLAGGRRFAREPGALFQRRNPFGDGAELGVEFHPVERLGEEEIDSGGQRKGTVGGLHLCRQHDEEGVVAARPVRLAYAPAELDAVHFGHHPVGDDEMGPLKREALPGRPAIHRGGDVVPFAFDCAAQQQGRDRVVFGDQDPHGVWLTPLSGIRSPGASGRNFIVVLAQRGPAAGCCQLLHGPPSPPSSARAHPYYSAGRPSAVRRLSRRLPG